MNRQLETRASLVVRLRDPQDQRAWDEFVDLYAPVIHAYAMHRGMQDADAADLAQDVLLAVARHSGRFDYDPARGSFRGWLFTIARNKIRTWYSRKPKRANAQGGTEMVAALHAVPDDDSDRDVWEHEHRRSLFHCAMERAKPDFRGPTWDAFAATAIDNRPAAEVARELGMTVGAVYIAKSRVLSRLRAEIELLDC